MLNLLKLWLQNLIKNQKLKYQKNLFKNYLLNKKKMSLKKLILIILTQILL
jgi:hypothetical protein